MKLTILFIVMLIFLNGCSHSKIIRIPDVAYTETSSLSYISTSGYMPIVIFDLQDSALVSRVNNFSINTQTYPVDVIEISTGEYEVYINACEESVFWSGIGLAGSRLCQLVEERTLTLHVEEDRLYVPFYDDACDASWVWIEDWGSAKEEWGAPSFNFDALAVETNFKKPVVSGVAPPEKCE